NCSPEGSLHPAMRLKRKSVSQFPVYLLYIIIFESSKLFKADLKTQYEDDHFSSGTSKQQWYNSKRFTLTQ
ncbi:MAG: hypothetical protein CL722_06775, partial [Chloroflexi bacterium]|nr:hypothetical protein [Chloroflexota bacterium]